MITKMGVLFVVLPLVIVMAYEEHLLKSVIPGTMNFEELYAVIEKDEKLSSRLTLRLDCFFCFRGMRPRDDAN